jgi:hypothetical protein
MQELWSIADLLHEDPHWRSAVISPTYTSTLNTERMILGKIVYIDNNDMYQESLQ